MKRVAILCNGPSLADHDLRRIDCETIGLNRSWELIPSTYHFMSDRAQIDMYRKARGEVDQIKGLWIPEDLRVVANVPDSVSAYKIRDASYPRFSFAPGELGVYLCSTVTWVALQFAVYWGYTIIYFVGLDLAPRKASGKFYGGPWHPSAEARQREVLGYGAGLLRPNGFELYNVGNDKSKCLAFPMMGFDEAFGG